MSELAAFFEDAAEWVLAAHCSPAVIDAAESGAFPTALWAELEALGAPLMLTAEDAGGLGAGAQDAAAVLAAAGRHAAPGPVLETMVANRVLAGARLAAPAGPCSLGFIGAGDADWTARPMPPVRLGPSVESAVFVVDDDAGGFLVTAPATAFAGAPADAAGEPLARAAGVALGGLEQTALGAGGYERALTLASALRAAQMVGALDWCLERSVAFSQERKQFGREIGKFQVIQQHMARLAGEASAAAAITRAALAAVDRAPDEAGGMVAAARSRLGDAVDVSTALAHQIHGAIGFTKEYPLSHRTRRLMAWRDEFRTVGEWRRRLAAPLAGAPAEAVWPALTALRA